MFKWATQAKEKGRGKRKGGSVCWSHVQLNFLAPLYAAVHTFYSWDSPCWNRKLTNTLKHTGNGSANWSSWKVQLLAKTWPTTPIRPCPPWQKLQHTQKDNSGNLFWAAFVLCASSLWSEQSSRMGRHWQRMTTDICLPDNARWLSVCVCVCGCQKDA